MSTKIQMESLEATWFSKCFNTQYEFIGDLGLRGRNMSVNIYEAATLNPYNCETLWARKLYSTLLETSNLLLYNRSTGILGDSPKFSENPQGDEAGTGKAWSLEIFGGNPRKSLRGWGGDGDSLELGENPQKILVYWGGDKGSILGDFALYSSRWILEFIKDWVA